MPAPPAPTRERTWLATVVAAAIALASAGGHLASYRSTPLGRVPVVDELENLLFAETIACGAPELKPFYRAPGYPFLLPALRASACRRPACFPRAHPGRCLHALNAQPGARIAGAWSGRRARMGAGLLLALHPVLVHSAAPLTGAGAYPVIGAPAGTRATRR